MMLVLRVVAGVTRRPWTALSGALCVALLSLWALSTVRVDSTLSGMLGGQNASAAALATVADEFHAAEDLLVLATAREGASDLEAEAALLDFGHRLEAELSLDPVAKGQVDSVRFQPHPGVEKYIRERLIPAGLLYLDDASFDAFLKRLAPTEVAAQLEQNRTMLAVPGPGAGALAKQLVKDPLRLREFMQTRLGDSSRSGPQFSDDRRSLLVRVSGVRPVNDIEFSKSFSANVEAAAGRASAAGVTVNIGGGYAIASRAATVIRADAISSSVWGVVTIYLFFIVVYRRLVSPLAIVLSAGLGVLAAFGLHAWATGVLTPLTAVLASMLAGMGVDYAIHFSSHHEALTAKGLTRSEASVRTVRDLGSPMLAACVTTIFGFGAVGLGEVRMLRDFAVLGCLGLAGALVSVLVLLPAMVQVMPKARGATWSLEWVEALIGVAGRRPRTCMGVMGVVLAVFVGAAVFSPRGLPAFESDMRVVHPVPNPAMETGEMVRAKFKGVGDTLLVLVRAETEMGLVEASHDVARALSDSEGSTGAIGLKRIVSLATFLPDPRLIEARMAVLRGLDREAILRDVRLQVEQSDFNLVSFEEYMEFLGSLLNPVSPPRLGDLAQVPEVASLLLPSVHRGREVADESGEKRALVLVTTTADASKRQERAGVIRSLRARLEPIPGAVLTGVTVVSHDFERAARRDLTRFGVVSLVLVLGWLILMFRSAVDILLAFIPVVFSLVCLGGVMAWFGLKPNTVNIVAIPLLIGIAVDSGIFLVSAARRAGSGGEGFTRSLTATVHGILGTSITTIIGFGTLYWTHTPATQSLGIYSFVGMLASLLGAVFFLLPLLILRSRRSHAGGGA